MMEYKQCKECGKEFLPSRKGMIFCCGKCQRKSNKRVQKKKKKKELSETKNAPEKEVKKITSNSSLVEMAAKARKAGMSYGQYVALQAWKPICKTK